MPTVQTTNWGYRDVSGAILLEVLLASSLSLILFLLLLITYQSRQRSTHLISSLTKLQMNAQKTIDILSSELHQAGYVSCRKLNDYRLSSLNELHAISGSRESITIRHASSHEEILTSDMTAANALHVENASRFKVGNVLIISDCSKAEIFKVNRVVGNSITADHALQYHFSRGAEVSRFESNQYYIKDKNMLIRVNDKGMKISLVSGVQAMNIRYISHLSRMVAVAIDLRLSEPPLTKTWHMYEAI